MTNERGGILRRLLVLGLCVWGVSFLYTHWWPQNNLQHFGGRLEHAVDQELTRQGITDRDVLSQVRKEHSLLILKWVETQRTIQVNGASRANDIARDLEKAAHQAGCSFTKKSSAEGITVELKRFLWTMQHITLVTSAKSVVPVGRKSPQVAFVIDDVAYETESMDRFASLGVPLTFAILPREKHSGQLAHKANAMNFPVMLHLPMEPLDVVHNDPGPSGLYLKMNEEELKKQFDKNVASIPNLVGINNHMGSAFTESEPKMTLVLEWVKMRGLYFLDSKTTGHSVVCKVAKRLGVPCLANETFLDNKDDVESIESQLDLVMKLAQREGQTIAIGHYRRKFLVQALANKLPEFKAHGVEIVTLPTFYRRAMH